MSLETMTLTVMIGMTTMTTEIWLILGILILAGLWGVSRYLSRPRMSYGTHRHRPLSDRELTGSEAKFMRKGKCPDCRSEKWLMGPQGGACTNILCAACYAEFNVGPLFSERLAYPGYGRKNVYGVPEDA